MILASLLIVSRQSDRPTAVVQRGSKPRSHDSRSHTPSVGVNDATAVPMPELKSKPTRGQHSQQDEGSASTSEASPGIATPQDRHSLANNNPISGVFENHEDSPAAISRSRGIQLAANVQLPAAIMALGRHGMTGPGQIPTLAEQAAREIETRFYQDLYEKTRVATEAEQDAGEDATTVITPGQEEKTARADANEVYRTLFGDEAYNRQTMSSLMEVHLPEDPADGNH